MKIGSRTVVRLLALSMSASCFAETADDGQTQVYFGDTHLHTSYSFDAFLNNNFSADPETAYRWAKGEPVIHPYNRARVQINTPLDFLVVSDHAEMLGVMREIRNDTIEWEDIGWYDSIKRWLAVRALNNALDDDLGRAFFGRFLPKSAAVHGGDPVADIHNNIGGLAIFGDTTNTTRDAWQDIIAAAEKHNDPGTFTSILGWEWSSIPTGANLHRIVVTPDGADKASQYIPYGSDQSQYPEDLWQWLDDTAALTDSRFISIPHNSNISKGYMFSKTTVAGEPITAEYASKRSRWEPLVEATQIKGDSETHPDLAPDDEFANFERYRFYIQGISPGQAYQVQKGDTVRSALKNGIELEKDTGVNPFKLGMIGSTDAHTSLASAEEPNFWGKMSTDSIPVNKRGPASGDYANGKTSTNGWTMSASGLAAVWSEDNSREAIIAAMKRRETYATTGPRIGVRFFGGWGYQQEDIQAADLAAVGYAGGVPMGGELASAPTGAAPRFLVAATKGALDHNLDRIQVIKLWLNNDGRAEEKIFNVAWSESVSGERALQLDGKLPAVGNSANIKTGKTANNIGAAQLSAVWIDPEFDAGQSSLYYLRVLQIPTVRHSQLDATALGVDTPYEGPATIQERAYTSPIWYSPELASAREDND